MYVLVFASTHVMHNTACETVKTDDFATHETWHMRSLIELIIRRSVLNQRLTRTRLPLL